MTIMINLKFITLIIRSFDSIFDIIVSHSIEMLHPEPEDN
jgi:hypothetical protein